MQINRKALAAATLAVPTLLVLAVAPAPPRPTAP